MDSSIHPRGVRRLGALLLNPSQASIYSAMAVPPSAPWAGAALILAIKNGFVQPDSILSHITHRLRIHNILLQVLLLSQAQF